MDDISTTAASHTAEATMSEVAEGDGLAAANAQDETGQSAQDSAKADADTSTTAAATGKASGRGGRGGGRGGRGGGAKGAGRGGAKAAAAAGGAKGKAAKESGGGGGGGGAGGANPTFPLARVARIVKADRDIETTSKDAIWIIAVATELFIKHLTDSAIAKARLEKKKIVTYKELASAVDTQPEFFFLSDVVPQAMPLEQAFGLRHELDEENRARAVGLIIDELSEDEVEEEETPEEGGEGGKEGGEAAPLADAALDEESAAAVPTKKAGTAANGKPKGKKYGKTQRATNEVEDNGGDVSTSSVKKAGGKAKKGRPTAEPAEDAEMVDE